MTTLRIAFALPALALLVSTSSGQVTLVVEGASLPTINGPSLVDRIDDVFVNNSGQWLVRVDTNAPTPEDEVILFNGVIRHQQGHSTGMSVPAGATFSSLDSAYIADNGDLLVVANITLAGGGASTVAYWNGALLIEPSVTPVVDPAVPPGSVWESLSEVWGTNTGRLLAGGRTDGGRDFIAKLTHNGAGLITGTQILAIDGQTLPGHPTAISGFSSARGRNAINDSGTALWFVDDDGLAPGGSNANDSWIHRDASPLWREGDPLPLFPPSVYGTLSSAEVDINNNGDYVLQSGRDASFTLDFIIKNDTTLIAEEGATLPSIAPFLLTTIGSTTLVQIGDNGVVLWYGAWNDPNPDRGAGLFVNREPVIQEGVTLVNGNVVDFFDSSSVSDKTFALSGSGRYAIVELTTIAPTDPTLNGAYLFDLRPPVGTSYCSPSVPNSSGNSARIEGVGSSVALTNNVTLVANRLPANQFGFFVTGRVQQVTTNPGGSQGNLCIGGTIGRYVGPGFIKFSGPGGTFDLRIDLNRTPFGNVFVSIAAGETWNFQAWFRDTGPQGQPWSNFTNGLTILFQ